MNSIFGGMNLYQKRGWGGRVYFSEAWQTGLEAPPDEGQPRLESPKGPLGCAQGVRDTCLLLSGLRDG